MLWRTYNLNVSACVLAQQGELLQSTAMPFTAFHFSLYCLIGLRLLACVVVVTLKLDFLKKMYGHLSDKSLCIILDNDNLIYVTSSEVLNAAVILGSCDACTAPLRALPYISPSWASLYRLRSPSPMNASRRGPSVQTTGTGPRRAKPPSSVP